MFDDRRSKGNPGTLKSCGIDGDNQQHFPGEAPHFIQVEGNMDKLTRGELLAAAAGAASEKAHAAFSQKQGNPPLRGWQYASAAFVAKAIQAKQVSSVELTKLMLDRIQKLNPKINAIVTITADAAMQRAKEADAALAKGERWGLLHGVPCTIKDTFETVGVLTTAGAPFLKDYVPKQDAVAVARMRAAGMVMIGKTNIPLMAGDWQSYNDLFPTSNNPWDLSRTPGGSTGGGAAATAAGLGYLTLGSDIGGSIRVPSHFCGLFGHKPTVDVVPLRGHIPPPPGATGVPSYFAVAGPLARSAADLLLALKVLGGPAPEDAVAYKWVLPPARKKSIREYKIRYVLDHPMCPVTAEVKKRLQAAVDTLRNAGASIEEGFPAGIDVADQYMSYLRLLASVMLDGSSEKDLERLRNSNPADDNLFWRAFKEAADGSQSKWAEANAYRYAARAAWGDYFHDYEAFLMPVDFIPAFPHDHSPDQNARVLQTPEGPRRYTDQIFWPSFAIMTGLPATAAPVGLTKDGLPVGVQILGPWLEDATPIFVAQTLEEEFGFQVPKGFE
jgi:amidase